MVMIMRMLRLMFYYLLRPLTHYYWRPLYLHIVYNFMWKIRIEALETKGGEVVREENCFVIFRRLQYGLKQAAILQNYYVQNLISVQYQNAVVVLYRLVVGQGCIHYRIGM